MATKQNKSRYLYKITAVGKINNVPIDKQSDILKEFKILSGDGLEEILYYVAADQFEFISSYKASYDLNFEENSITISHYIEHKKSNKIKQIKELYTLDSFYDGIFDEDGYFCDINKLLDVKFNDIYCKVKKGSLKGCYGSNGSGSDLSDLDSSFSESSDLGEEI
jgi:hypothetical protein